MSQISTLIGQHYTYAYGRIGTLQQLLMQQTDVDRLLGAHDRHDAEKVLTELKMTSQIDQGISQWEEILRALGTWMRQEVEVMTPEAKRATFSIVWLADAAPLLSYLLKKYHGLTSPISTEPQQSMQSYSEDVLEAYRSFILEGKSERPLPEHLQHCIQHIRSLKEPTAQRIDSLIMQHVTDTQIRLARSSGSKHILNYVLHMIDLQNIRMALRSDDTDVLSQQLLSGGTITPQKLIGTNEHVAATVRNSAFYDLADYIETDDDDPVALERNCEEVIRNDIAQMWNIPMSIEPLFAFAAITMNHLNVIRTIIIGKSNGLSPQEIKKILPPFIPATHYVL